MDGYRIANLIMQAIYLPVHLMFIIKLVKARQASPVWKCFIAVVVGLLMLITGRLMESVLYLFYPNNRIYTFAVYFQLVGTTLATTFYLFWNLYLAEKYKAADNRVFRISMIVLAVVSSVIVCTSHINGLFYEKLVLGEQVVHGKMFVPCVIFVYGSLFAGYVVSVINIIRSGDRKILRLVVFSMYPLLPAITNLMRSISGVDRIDTNPLVMSVSIFCLYLIVFRERLVGIIPETMDSILDQTTTPIFIYNAEERKISYINRIAENEYKNAVDEIVDDLVNNGLILPKNGSYDGRELNLFATQMEDKSSILVRIEDMTENVMQQKLLAGQIRENEALLAELDEQKRNIVAYLDVLYEIPELREKQEMVADTEKRVSEAFVKMEENLKAALADDNAAVQHLNDNINVAEETIKLVRSTVGRLREV